MRCEAQLEIDRKKAEAAEKIRAIVAEYDRLVREKNQFLRKIKVSMESELAVIDKTLEELPDPDREERTAASQQEGSGKEQVAAEEVQEG